MKRTDKRGRRAVWERKANKDRLEGKIKEKRKWSRRRYKTLAILNGRCGVEKRR